MALAKCPRCDELFDKISTQVCLKCVDDEEKDIDSVRAAVQDNPNMNAEAVSELTGVAVSCVLRMMDTGTISSITFGEKVECGRCGAPAISATKRLCQACLEALNSEMASAQKQIKIDEKKQVEVGRYSSSMRANMDKKRSDG